MEGRIVKEFARDLFTLAMLFSVWLVCPKMGKCQAVGKGFAIAAKKSFK